MAQTSDNIAKFLVQIQGDANFSDIKKAFNELERETKQFSNQSNRLLQTFGKQQIFPNLASHLKVVGQQMQKTGATTSSIIKVMQSELSNYSSSLSSAFSKSESLLKDSLSADQLESLKRSLQPTLDKLKAVQQSLGSQATSALKAEHALGTLTDRFNKLRVETEATGKVTRGQIDRLNRLVSSTTAASKQHGFQKEALSKLRDEVASYSKQIHEAQNVESSWSKASSQAEKALKSSSEALDRANVSLSEYKDSLSKTTSFADFDKIRNQAEKQTQTFSKLKQEVGSYIPVVQRLEKQMGTGSSLSDGLKSQIKDIQSVEKQYKSFAESLSFGVDRIKTLTSSLSRLRGTQKQSAQVTDAAASSLGRVTELLNKYKTAAEFPSNTLRTELNALKSTLTSLDRTSATVTASLKQIGELRNQVLSDSVKDTPVGKQFLKQLDEVEKGLLDQKNLISESVSGQEALNKATQKQLSVLSRLNALQQESKNKETDEAARAQKVRNLSADVERLSQRLEVARQKGAAAFDPAEVDKFSAAVKNMTRDELRSVGDVLRQVRGDMRRVANDLDTKLLQGDSLQIPQETLNSWRAQRDLASASAIEISRMADIVNKEFPHANKLREFVSLQGIPQNFRDINHQLTTLTNGVERFFIRTQKLREGSGFKGLSGDMKRGVAALREFETNVISSQARFHDMAFGFTLLGTAVATVLGTAIRLTAQFGDTIALVKGITGATEAEFEQLTKTAQLMGATTRFTALEAAEGLRLLGMAGFDANEAIKALPTTLQLAMAAGLDLASTADIVTNIMTPFRLTAEQLPMAADVLTKAFTTSNSTLTELGFAFKFVGSLVEGMEGSFTDLVGSLALLHNAGIKATMAGTALRTVLDSLFNPTAAEARVMAELSERIGGVGLQLLDAEGKFVGFASLIKQLEKAGLTSAEALKLFGQRGGPGLSSLLKIGSEAIDDYVFSLDNAAGTTAKISDTMESTLMGAFLRVKSAVEALAEDFGSTLEPVLKSVANSIADTISVLLSLMDAFPPLRTAIHWIVAAFGVLLPVLGAVAFAWAFILIPIRQGIKAILTFMTLTARMSKSFRENASSATVQTAAVTASTRAITAETAALTANNAVKAAAIRENMAFAASNAVVVESNAAGGLSNLFNAANISQVELDKRIKQSNAQAARQVGIFGTLLETTVEIGRSVKDGLVQGFSSVGTKIEAAKKSAAGMNAVMGALHVTMAAISGTLAVIAKFFLFNPLGWLLIAATSIYAIFKLWPKRVEEVNIELQKTSALAQAQITDAKALTNLYERSQQKLSESTKEWERIQKNIDKTADSASNLEDLIENQNSIKIQIEADKKVAQQRLNDLIEFLQETSEQFSSQFTIKPYFELGTGNIEKVNVLWKQGNEELGIQAGQIDTIVDSTGKLTEQWQRFYSVRNSKLIEQSTKALIENVSNLASQYKSVNGARLQVLDIEAQINDVLSQRDSLANQAGSENSPQIEQLNRRLFFLREQLALVSTASDRTLKNAGAVSSQVLNNLNAVFLQSRMSFDEFERVAREALVETGEVSASVFDLMFEKAKEAQRELPKSTLTLNDSLGQLTGVLTQVKNQFEAVVEASEDSLEQVSDSVREAIELVEKLTDERKERFEIKLSVASESFENQLSMLEDKASQKMFEIEQANENLLDALERRGQVNKKIELSFLKGLDSRLSKEHEYLQFSQRLNIALKDAILKTEQEKTTFQVTEIQNRMSAIRKHYDEVIALAQESGQNTVDLEAERTQAILKESQKQLSIYLKQFARIEEQRRELKNKMLSIQQEETSAAERLEAIKQGLGDKNLTLFEKQENQKTQLVTRGREIRSLILSGEFDAARELMTSTISLLESASSSVQPFQKDKIRFFNQFADRLKSSNEAITAGFTLQAARIEDSYTKALKQTDDAIKTTTNEIDQLQKISQNTADKQLKLGLEEQDRQLVKDIGVDFDTLTNKIGGSVEKVKALQEEMLKTGSLANEAFRQFSLETLTADVEKMIQQQQSLLGLQQSFSTLQTNQKPFDSLRKMSTITSAIVEEMQNLKASVDQVNSVEIDFLDIDNEKIETLKRGSDAITTAGKNLNNVLSQFLSLPAATKEGLVSQGFISDEDLKKVDEFVLKWKDVLQLRFPPNVADELNKISIDSERAAQQADTLFGDLKLQLATLVDPMEMVNDRSLTLLRDFVTASNLAGKDAAEGLRVPLANAMDSLAESTATFDLPDLAASTSTIQQDLNRVSGQLNIPVGDVTVDQSVLERLGTGFRETATKALENLKPIIDFDALQKALYEKVMSVKVRPVVEGGLKIEATGGMTGGSVTPVGIQSFANGGQVLEKAFKRMSSLKVPGVGKGDKVPIMAEAGEAILKGSSVRRQGLPFIDFLNKTQINVPEAINNLSQMMNNSVSGFAPSLATGLSNGKTSLSQGSKTASPKAQYTIAINNQKPITLFGEFSESLETVNALYSLNRG